MTTVAIVAYPCLDAADAQWIESIRSAHDPQSSRLGVHFTLVFPTELSSDTLAAEAVAVAREVQPIAFTIRRANAVPDHTAGGHVFLVPDEGRDEIFDLHRLLHRGRLRSELREDLPFTPHMTIAAHSDMATCDRVAEEINAYRRMIRGTLAKMNLVAVDGPRINTLSSFVLGPISGAMCKDP